MGGNTDLSSLQKNLRLVSLPAFSDFRILAMSSDGSAGKAVVEAKGLNPGLIVLLVIGGLLVTFLIANYVMYMYAQKNLPPRKKKPLSKKKLKREKLKQGVPVPGE
jgi:hypothetical protein